MQHILVITIIFDLCSQYLNCLLTIALLNLTDIMVSQDKKFSLFTVSLFHFYIFYLLDRLTIIFISNQYSQLFDIIRFHLDLTFLF